MIGMNTPYQKKRLLIPMARSREQTGYCAGALGLMKHMKVASQDVSAMHIPIFRIISLGLGIAAAFDSWMNRPVILLVRCSINNGRVKEEGHGRVGMMRKAAFQGGRTAVSRPGFPLRALRARERRAPASIPRARERSGTCIPSRRTCSRSIGCSSPVLVVNLITVVLQRSYSKL